MEEMSKELDFEAIESLVVQSQKGDERSFETLFDWFYPKLYRYISFKVDREEIEDILSDVFLKVVRKIQDYSLPKNQKTGFSSWIFRVANNTVIDFYRTKKLHTSLHDSETGELVFDLPDTEPLPNEQAQHHFEAQEIRKVLEKLSPTHREILELKYLEEFSHTEIAHILGKTEGNVRIMSMRALREMRKHFEG